MAICFHHIIGDATTAANFVRTWAALASGASHNFINKDVKYLEMVSSGTKCHQDLQLQHHQRIIIIIGSF